MVDTRWWGVFLSLCSSLALASPIRLSHPHFGGTGSTGWWVEPLVRRQDPSNGAGGSPSNSVKTTIIFASILGGFLAAFVTFSLFSILRSKFGMRMPTIPMPDPPTYLSLFRLGRRNPEDIGPPLPVYMEQPDGSTTVLQRSESRRTSRTLTLDDASNRDAHIINLPRNRDSTLTNPPPYMKDPPPLTFDVPRSPMQEAQLLTPPPSLDGHGRAVERESDNRRTRSL